MTASSTPPPPGSGSTPTTAHDPGALPFEEAAAVVEGILDEVCRAVVGKRDVIRLILAGLFADGHILLDDVPGVAKTLTARSIAAAAGLEFSRVQFTPDVLPADITGSLVLDLATHRPEFRPGPVFTNLLLADEVNRAPAKTQAALLEAMQERQVTADGTTHPLPRPFLVIATQNPIESEGTYPLPGGPARPLPDPHDHGLSGRGRRDRHAGEPGGAPHRRGGHPPDLRRRHLRGGPALAGAHPRGPAPHGILRGAGAGDAQPKRQLAVGSSPRGTLALVKLARAAALLAGREYVGPDDIRGMAVPALAHRVVLSDDAWARRANPEDVVRRAVDRVPVPQGT